MRAVAFIALTLLYARSFAAPFPTTDQNPLLNGMGYSQPVAARLPAKGATDFGATLNWSNTAIIQNSSNETLVVDMESREWRVSLEHAVSDNLLLRVQLPYRTASGGSLDGFIENWHSLFGFPNGDRPKLPHDDFRIDYRRNGSTVLAYGNGISGIGDLSLDAGYQLHAESNAATSLWWNIKLPTGDNTKLTGNGAIATSFALAHEQKVSTRWTVFGQTNATYLRPGDFLPDQQRQIVWSGMLGFDYRYSPTLTLTMQLDGHTAAFNNTGLDFLGNAWILTTGGEYRWRSHWRMQLGISEDVKVRASPDVNFVFSLAREWK